MTDLLDARKSGTRPVSRDEVRAMVSEAVASISAPALRSAAESVLMEPRLEHVSWDYGQPGEKLPCWVIADLRPERHSLVLYCTTGFGPTYPFGVADADLATLGTDGNWYLSFEDALRATIWSGKNPPGFEVG